SRNIGRSPRRGSSSPPPERWRPRSAIASSCSRRIGMWCSRSGHFPSRVGSVPEPSRLGSRDDDVVSSPALAPAGLGANHFSRPDLIYGFHGPGSTMWRVNREAVLLGAGPAALLLQIAHPHAAEGVAQQTDSRAFP